MTTSNQALQRLDYLDAVRAFALLLGIVFHASLSFLPVYIGWAIMDISTSALVGTFMLISHSFRMALFFLVAGFFSHMTFHRKGATGFIQSRLIRIVIPFVVGWFLLRPLLVSGWVMGMQSLRGEVAIIASLNEGFNVVLGSLNAAFTGTHLWFLYYLLLATAAVLLMRQIVVWHPRSYRALTQRVDAVVHWLAHSRLAFIVAAIPTVACLWFMGHWGMDTPDKSLVPQWPVLFIYGVFFALGWLLHRQGNVIEAFGRISVGKVFLGVVASMAAVLLSGFEGQPGHPQYPLIKALFLFSYAVMMWSLVALTIGAFKRLFNRPSKTVRYLAGSSYWLYLIHLPIVIWLQIAFAEIPWPWGVKLILISGITIAVCLLLYDVLVRASIIGLMLNGARKRRVLFAWRRTAAFVN
ncbi:acyltransferase family protein [uncultured Gilvimarinus sp.]|uniref:acyltransferase family protein n=1 Tax=uncultured Gilvimarinus sp. TaxID=1689143 RepID=UPI0030DD0D79